MREALAEVIDLLIMYVCEWMQERTLLGFPEHLYYSGDTMQIICIKGFCCTAEERAMAAFLCISHNGKLMLTNFNCMER